MYINKCSKCGKEFETKNPKRVICPECLYPDRSPLLQNNNQDQNKDEQPKQELVEVADEYTVKKKKARKTKAKGV